jgi:hypothetical protein
MRSLRRPAWILSALLLAPSGCKSELDDKPAADPLEDPWVGGIDSGAEPVAAAPPSEPEVAVEPEPEPEPESAEAAPDPIDPTDPTDLTAPTDPAAGVLAIGPSSAKPKSAATPEQAGANEPAPEPATAPEPVEPSAAPAAKPNPSAEPAKPAAPPEITIADFHGNYRFAGGNTQRSELEAAIEAAANQLPGAIRGIGRKRLTKTNPIDNTLEIVIAGDKVTTIFETGFDATCVIDGPTVHWSNNKGDAYKVRVRSKGNKIVQIIEGDDGVKTTVFVLSTDKQKLTVHHKITADRLPEPMTYRLSYSRK